MYTSQQASYKALPSSTRSRRVSSNHSTRPALHQAEHTPAERTPVGHIPTERTHTGYTQTGHTQTHTANPGITLQSWARSHVQPTDQRRLPSTGAPAPMFQAQYQYARPQSSSRDSEQVRFAVADYFDPYQNTPRGQTLNVDAERTKSTKPAVRNAGPNTPPSPVMRAVRHSRPTTPNALGPSSSRDSLASLPGQRHYSPSTQFPPAADTQNVFGRMKPRAYTSNEPSSPPTAFQPRVQPAQPAQPLRPRVSSMYVDSSVPAAQMQVEVGHAPAQRVSSAALQSRSSATSSLANAAIRDFVDVRASRTPKKPNVQPWPAVVNPDTSRAASSAQTPQSSGVSAERSHLIEFIERQRARTMAATATETKSPEVAKPTTGTSNSPPGSKGSDMSERSFKRSTARLAEVAPAQRSIGDTSSNSRGFKYTSWYTPPVRTVSTAADSAHSSPGISPIAALPPPISNSYALPPPLPSTRIVPRTRAQSVVEEKPHDMWQAAHGRIPNKPEAVLARRSNDALPKSYSRHSRPTSSAGTTPRSFTATGMQTDAPQVRSSGMQTPSNAIHGDDAVLDLMRQMDALRQGHANQISEYQEQVIDMELVNQELSTEVDQLSAQLEAKETAHKQMADDMRQKLELTNQRVDREINEVKSMHAAKCDELASQVSMLLRRCTAYKAKLESLGVDEHELLTLSATKQSSDQIQTLQIADQAFIESQFIETRESSIEADYFKQLMDIERSMENTTIALGFELKRTQAKYLQQAADFIREQMARLQVDRPDSRLTLRRSDSRATIGSMRSPTFDSSPDPANAGRLSGSQSPVRSLAASLSQLSKTQPLPPLPPNANSLAKQPLRPHQRIVGPEPSSVLSSAPIDEAAEDAVFSGKPANLVLQGSDTPGVVRRMPASDALGIAQRAASDAVLSNVSAPGHAATHDTGSESESRTSGLSRMIAASAASSHTSAPSDAANDYMTDMFMLSSPRRSHRSPLAGIASGFFSSSQESMATAVATSEPTASTTSSFGLMDSHVQPNTTPTHALTMSQPNLTPTKSAKPMGSFTEHRSLKGTSMGYFSGRRHDASEAMSWSPQQGKSASVHWPPRSERKPASRPQSALGVDSHDMTAEQLLESLKLPSTNMLGMATPTRNAGSFSSSPSGSLGRHSPLPRSGSYSDLCRTFPSAPRFTLPEQPNASRADSHELSGSVRSFKFDPNADIKIDLGLGPAPEKASLGFNSSRRSKRPPRRRSRSVGTWGSPLTNK
ncbi:hypothetical protein GGF49_002105 [Coemansia sp. RSA 1853]|nr:hypothetical protein LPJ76_001952 [Coemansia sp. RSA 638]KAJ2543402.1 hypothetical protein GGF49_002105 [Coemansia sp. RSA 1853]